jgi:hypothetical protein
MSGDAKIVAGLIVVAVVVLIEDARAHYTRSLEKLQEAPDVTPAPPPAPIMESRLDDWHALSDVDAGLTITGAPPEFFATMMGG